MNYNYQELKKLSQNYLKGKNLTVQEKQQLRNAFNALYVYQAQQELFLIVQSLKDIKKKALQKNNFQTAMSCDHKLSIIFRDKLKVGTEKQIFNPEQNQSPVKHIRQLYPNLSDDNEICKAAAYQIAKIRAKE